eukprot:tig00021127_g18745.t1
MPDMGSLVLAKIDPLDDLLERARNKPKSRRAALLDLSEPLSELSRKDALTMWISLHQRAQAAADKCREAAKGTEDVSDAVQAAAELARCGFALARHAVAADDKALPQSFYDALLWRRAEAAGEAAERGVAGAAREALAEAAELAHGWWTARRKHYETVVPELVPLVARRLALRPLPAPEIKKAYAMRGAFTLACKEEAAGELARRKEGPKLAAHLLALRADVAAEAHAAVLAALPHAAPAAVEGHAHALLRAWRAASAAAAAGDSTAAATAAALEDAVQGTAQRALTARTPALGAALRGLLGGLHRAAGRPAVGALLARLYEPLLWRALTAANPAGAPRPPAPIAGAAADEGAVRRNAAGLLAEVFPLPPAGGAPEAEVRAELQRQAAALEAALEDGDVRVRLAATEGAGRLLRRLPQSALAAALARRSAFDAASPAVRAAALAALAPLVDEPLAHGPLAGPRPAPPPVHRAAGWLRGAGRRGAAGAAAAAGRPERGARAGAAGAAGARRAALEASADGLAEVLAPVFMPASKGPADCLRRFVALAQHCPEAAPAFYARAVAPRAGGRGGPVPLPRLASLFKLWIGCVGTSLERRRAPFLAVTRGGRAGAAAAGGGGEEARVADAALEAAAAAWEAAGPLLARPEHSALAPALSAGLSGGLLDALLACYALPNPDLPAAFRRPGPPPAPRSSGWRGRRGGGGASGGGGPAGRAGGCGAGRGRPRGGGAPGPGGRLGPRRPRPRAPRRRRRRHPPRPPRPGDEEADEAAGKRKRPAAPAGRQRARQQQRQRAAGAAEAGAGPGDGGAEGEGRRACAPSPRCASSRASCAAAAELCAALGRSAPLLGARLRAEGSGAAGADFPGPDALLRALSAHARLACALRAEPAPEKGRRAGARRAARSGKAAWPEELSALARWALDTPGLFPCDPPPTAPRPAPLPDPLRRAEGAGAPGTPSGARRRWCGPGAPPPAPTRARAAPPLGPASRPAGGGDCGGPRRGLAERAAEALLSALADAAGLFALPAAPARAPLWDLLRRAGSGPAAASPPAAAAASRLLCALASAAAAAEGGDGAEEAAVPAGAALAAGILRRCSRDDASLARALRPALACLLAAAGRAAAAPAPPSPPRARRRGGLWPRRPPPCEADAKLAPGSPLRAALESCLTRAPAAARAALLEALASPPPAPLSADGQAGVAALRAALGAAPGPSTGRGPAVAA